MKITKIISGGQTGADRAGLDVAIALGLEHGGWVTKGRRAEDGTVPDRYEMTETGHREYDERTLLNVRDSDATLILYPDRARTKWGGLKGGTKLTQYDARLLRKHVLVVDPYGSRYLDTRRWLDTYPIETLNIAGPRESKQPGIYAASYAFLMRVLGAEVKP